MKHIKPFGSFILERYSSETVVLFSSPLYVTEKVREWAEDIQNHGGSVEDFARKMQEFGIDVSYALQEYKNSEREDEDEEAFYDSVFNDELKEDMPELLHHSNVDDPKLDRIIVDAFNEDAAEITKYAAQKVNGVVNMECEKVEDGLLFIAVTYENRPSEADIEKTKDYLTGQYSDGWGEGFEQQDLKIGNNLPDVNIHAYPPHSKYRDNRKNWKISHNILKGPSSTFKDVPKFALTSDPNISHEMMLDILNSNLEISNDENDFVNKVEYNMEAPLSDEDKTNLRLWYKAATWK